MKSAQTTAFSGCLIWLLLVFFISSCILPIATIVGSISSFSEFAIKTTGGYLCPEGTTPESYTYASTTTDEFGNSHPATAYELHCVDSSGNVVKEDPIVYAFLWIGVFVVVGLLLSVILAFVFAVPGGMLVTRILNKLKSPKAKNNID